MESTEKKPAQAPEVRRGWWRRNWKRLVVGLFVVVILAASGGYYYLFGRFMLSEPFKVAWQEVTKSKEVNSELGGPIDGVWGFPRFDVTLHGEDNLPGKRIDVAGEINRERPPDVPVFDAATQKLA